MRDELATLLRMLTREAPYTHGDLPAPDPAERPAVEEEAAPAAP